VLFHGPGDVRTIRYHIERMEVPEERERAEARLREVLRFVDSGVCRRKLLLAHFDEEHPGDCGNCDVCTGGVELEDLTVAAQKVLSAAYRTGQRFGAHHLADVVSGNATDKVLERGHHQLPTFGVGSDTDKGFWLSLIRDLENGGYLERADGQKSGFRITALGRKVLKGSARFSAARQAPGRGGQARGRGAGGRGNEGAGVSDIARAGGRGGGGARSESDARRAADASPAHERRRADDEELFACLRRLRKRLARERGVPPYVIFSDKTLRSITRNRPTDEAALLRCHGVGERKLAEYGEAFLRCVREFLAGAGCEE
jgi:ATP-dependent DNA helicase RecQ